jgi:hypothetical protein
MIRKKSVAIISVLIVVLHLAWVKLSTTFTEWLTRSRTKFTEYLQSNSALKFFSPTAIQIKSKPINRISKFSKIQVFWGYDHVQSGKQPPFGWPSTLIRSILIFFSYLRLGITIKMFHSVFPIKMFYAFLSPNTHAKCLVRLLFPQLIIPKMFGERYKT